MSVVVSTVTSLYDLAVDLLDAVVAAMATTDAGAPTRSYVSLGEPAFGPEACDQAAVQVQGLTEGQTSPSIPPEITGQRSRYGRINEATMVAYAVRCVPVSDGNNQIYAPLTVDELNGMAQQAYQDGWAIWNYVNYAIRNGTLSAAPAASPTSPAAPHTRPRPDSAAGGSNAGSPWMASTTRAASGARQLHHLGRPRARDVLPRPVRRART